MVRAGVVGHPSEWRHSAWRELCGGRERCRIINRDRLLSCLWMGNMEEFIAWHKQTIEEKLRWRDQLRRESFWSTAVAVGDDDWLVKINGLKRHEIVVVDGVSYLRGIGRRS